MSRLFVTQREIDFISDITKELLHDICGHSIKYYAVSEIKTLSHDVYDEAAKKLFDHPIIIDAFIDSSFNKDTIINSDGVDKQYKIEVFLSYRDCIERGINPTIGDFFTFSDLIFEISEARTMRNIFGFAEFQDGVRLVGHPVRQGAIDLIIKGPTDQGYTDPDAVQNTFYQQRGYASNKDGDTNDTRALQQSGVLEPPISPPREVSKRADTHNRNAFYDEED